MGKYDNKPYEVGKGKPPRAYCFKPGVSGNPKGPKHKKKDVDATLAVLVHEALCEMVTVVIAGREHRLPKKQAIIFQTVNDALTGTPTQRLKVLKMLHDVGGFDLDVTDNRMTPEMQEENAYDLIDMLIEEGKKQEEGRIAFANYHRILDPKSGKMHYQEIG